MSTWVLLLYLLTVAARAGLTALNLRHLSVHGKRVPEGFEDAVDGHTLERTARYTVAKTRVEAVESLAGALLIVSFLFGAWALVYERWVAAATDSFVWGGVLYFLGLHYAQTALGIPFSLYRTFRLEARYGFNRTTPTLWIADLLKGELVASILLGAVAAAGLGLVRWTPSGWWLWVWAFFAVFTLILMYVSPYLIEPLFFKFEPLRSPDLEEDIRAVTAKAGVKISRILQVDASRRSAHSNAYFTGIGKVKRIVIFDTLLEQMRPPEIIAVLAHELGHWKLRHVLQRILLTEGLALAVLWAAQRALAWDGLPHLVGLPEGSFLTRVVILAFLGGILAFPFSPLTSAWSRRHERDADRFACRLTGDPSSLASALVKLGSENLANLHPHPLYAWAYYSHPPLAERVARLRRSQPPRDE